MCAFYFSAAVPWRVAENDPPPYCSTAGLIYLSVFVFTCIPMYCTATASWLQEYRVPESNGLGERFSEQLEKEHSEENETRKAPWVQPKPPQHEAGLGIVH